MAADFVTTTGSVTLTAAATKSLILVNPVTVAVTIIGLDVSFDAAAASAGILISLYTVTTLGSPAGTAAVVNKMDVNSNTAATMTGLTALSAEPTTVAVVASWYVQPFGGLWPQQLPLGREFRMAGAGIRWGVRYVTPASVSPNCVLNLYTEE